MLQLRKLIIFRLSRWWWLSFLSSSSAGCLTIPTSSQLTCIQRSTSATTYRYWPLTNSLEKCSHLPAKLCIVNRILNTVWRIASKFLGLGLNMMQPPVQRLVLINLFVVDFTMEQLTRMWAQYWNWYWNSGHLPGDILAGNVKLNVQSHDLLLHEPKVIGNWGKRFIGPCQDAFYCLEVLTKLFSFTGLEKDFRKFWMQ